MDTTTQQQRTPIPLDEKLPQIAQLLDPDAMASVLARSLDGTESLEGVQIRYLRYRHGKNLVVHYEAEIDAVGGHAVSITSSKYDLSCEPAKPEHRARARLVEGRSPAADAIWYAPELRALIYWLPFDPDLPALSEPPRSLRSRLEREGIELVSATGEPLLLQYRPRRRATLRLDSHVVKIYRYEADFAEGVRGLRASAEVTSVRTARCEAVVPEWKLTVQELLPGSPPKRRGDAARDAGAVLAGLHGADLGGLPPLLPSDRLEAVAESVKLVSAVAPTLATRAQSLVARLESESPDGDLLVPSHGDYHGGQLLELVEGEYGLIDFDLLRAAAPAFDVANYAGHLVAQEGLDVAEAATLLDALVEGYGSRPPGLSWYLSAAILRSARGPFKRFEQNWPERIETTVGAAEAALEL
jgi:Phosphotransferase enzyme family